MIEYTTRGLVSGDHAGWKRRSRIRIAWANEPSVYLSRFSWDTNEDGWYLSVSYDIVTKKELLVLFAKGFSVSSSEPPFLSPSDDSDVREVNDGIVAGGHIAEQIVFEAMYKRVPKLLKEDPGKLSQRTVHP